MDFCSTLRLPSSTSPSSSHATRSSSTGGTRSLVVTATSRSSSSRSSEYCSLPAPLKLETEAGRFLTEVFMNTRNKKEDFQSEAKKVLQEVGSEKDQALARRDLTKLSDEAFLHRRIAELKELQCQTAVEDVMYLMIMSKFSEIRVFLIPKLSDCIYNSRLEMLPYKHCELESIHSDEVVEMIREHLAAVVGWRSVTNVKDSWTLTKIKRLPLCQMYAASILYGYFLKSALLRHRLEQSLGHVQQDLGTIAGGTLIPLRESGHLDSRNTSLGHIGGAQSTSLGEVSLQDQGGLKGYVRRFDSEVTNICAKPWSKESVNLIQRHKNALFGAENTGLLDTNDTILTSFATLKRFCLEGIAFGSFLWETEEDVNSVYELGDNR